MAIRSNAGTGVIVSLVVFVLTTVFLLVLSIVFYASGRAEKEEVKNLTKSLSTYTTKGNENNALVEFALESKQPVVSYLINEIEERNQILTGNRHSTIEEIASVFRDTTSTSSSLALSVDSTKRELDSRQQELDSRISELANAKSTIQSLEDQLAALAKSNLDEVELVKGEWQDVQDESVRLNSDVNDLFTSSKKNNAQVRNDFKNMIQGLEDEIEDARLTIEKQNGELKELRKQRNIGELYKTDPSLLVDGEVIEVSNDDLVFINRGSVDKIRLGMTFEVYDSANHLIEDADGNMALGKASIEVVKVGETTSTAKIKRSTRNQPILKNNVLVNAIYDPHYKFSFLVHGIFDVDGDGVPESTNDFVKNRIKRWGGVVVEDNGSIPGDLDFLVLGITPHEPLSKPRSGASDTMLENYANKQRAYRSYMQLLEDARAANVPVLTANRLNILTGQQAR
jgi:hypothetical protein